MGSRNDAKEILMLRPDSSVPSRLLKAVVAKSFIEVVLVCAVATLAAFSTFSPRLRGALDVADQTRVAGWALADEERIDLVSAGVTSNPNHGFNFDLTQIKLAPGRHTAQVYALRPAAGANKILLPIAKQPCVFEVGH